MNKFKSNLSKEVKLLLILFLFIFKLTEVDAQICGTCTTPNCTITDNTSATDGNITVFSDCYTLPTPATSGTVSNCYTITTNSTGKLGFRLSEDIRQNQASMSNCGPSNMDAIDNSRTYTLKLASAGCGGVAIAPSATNVNNSATGFNPEWYSLTPNTAYVLCVTITLPNDYCQFEKICMVGYHLTGTPTPPCTSTIGTVAVSGATANGSEWDLSPGGTVSMTASGYVLPSNGGASPCTATYGYIVYDQAPTLPLAIGTFSTLPGFKGISTGITCTDDNNAGQSSSVATANKLWYVPLTADCKNGGGTPLDVDANGDLCYAFGTSAIVVNYLAATPCGSCTNPVCPIYLTAAPSASPSTTYPNTNHIVESTVGPNVTTECHTVTVANSNQTLGFRQSIQFNQGTACTTRTFSLYATDGSGHCTGSAINPTRAMGTYSTIFNPEWDNLPAGNYVMCITQTTASGCDIDYINTGYYLLNLPAPPCPVDQSFVTLDWAVAPNFPPFPNTTYTCSSGPQTIWKNVDATIGTGGELQSYPGFQMDMTTNSNSPTKTSAVVSVNGVAYSYYGAGPLPVGLIDGGAMASSNQKMIEPYLPAGATITVTISDQRAGSQSFPYTIYDHSTGAILASGTATPNSTTPTVITFTLSSPTMTWKLDGGTANIIDNNNGSATFNPSNLTPGSHTITYTWTNNAGCNITATKTINVGQTTVAPTTAPVAYCQGATASALNVTPSAGCTLNWYGTNQTGGTASSTAPTPLTTGTGTTTYYVSQTNTTTTCESPRATLVVTINPNPTLSITDPATVCMPSTVDITAGTVTAGSTTGGSFTYFINPGATTALPTPAAVSNSGTYYIKSTVGSCSTVLPVTVLINNCACPYNIAITTPAAVCSPNTVDITDPAVTAGSVGGGTLSYWSDQACTNSITTVAAAAISSSGTYYIKGDNGVCNDTKPVVVTINTTPSLTIVNPTAVCSPNTIDITLPAVTAGSSGNGTLTYWNDAGATNSTLATPNAITSSNTYYIKSANGSCNDIKPVVVTINPLPLALPIYSASYCQNAATSPISTTASAGCTLNWYQNLTGGTSTNITPTVSSSTVGVNSYYVTQTNANGCESATPRTKIEIIVNAIPVVTVNSPSVCYGDSITLTASGATTYSWDIGWAQGVSNKNPFKDKTLTNAKYKVRGTTNGCSSSAISDITIKPLPTIAYEDTLAICFPGSVDLTSSQYSIGSTPLSTFDYYVNKTATSPLTGASTIETDGKYYIQATLNGCKSTIDSVVVNIQQKPAVYFTPSPAVVTTTNPVSTMINGTIGGSTYFWNFGDTGTSTEIKPEHNFPNADTLTYQVTLVAVSKEGCIDSLKKTVRVIEDLLYYVPNSFTPDGDQYNQEFKPIFTSGFDHKGYQMYIFDRWGNLVFETTDYTKGWDGKRLGSKEKVQDGSYTWKILFSIKSDDRREEIHGHVNVIR